MTRTEVVQIIKEELPTIYMEDEEIHRFIFHMISGNFAEKQETESRFDRLLRELQRDREENTRHWKQQEKKWAEESQRWQENNQRWQENNQRWQENNRRWDEQEKKWFDNQATINAMLAEIKQLSRKHDSTIGALGARWGLHTEASFRNALKSILEESFGVKVLNVTEYDDSGEVFGSPDQVELDVIIRNGVMILCEIKSSMSRNDVHVFHRKVQFYERLHQRKATRTMIISPMVEDYAKKVAERFGIEVFSYAEDVDFGDEPVGKELKS